MKNIINRIKNDKVLFFLSILIIGVFLVLVIRITYSYLAAFINEARENVTIGSDTTDKLEFFEGNPIDLNVTATTLPEGGGNYAQSTTYRAELTANSTNNTAEDSYYVYFNVTANTLNYTQEGNPEVILTVFQGETEITNIDGLTYGTYNGVTGFDVTEATGLFTVASDYAITSNSSTTATVQNWTFTLTYLNQNYDQSGNYGNNMNVEFIMTKEEKTPSLADLCNGLTLSECITTQAYTGVDGENGLYYHDTDLANGAGDNSYRYAGANPNNYVCFGSIETPCPAENLYRIIGVLNDNGEYQVKLIKSDYTTSAMLGTDGRDYYGSYVDSMGESSYYKGNMTQSDIAAYRWNYDTSVSNNGSNNWTTSEFNKINLNTNYWNYLGETWQNLIATTTWHLGGMASTSNIAKAFYDGERNNAGFDSNPTTYTDEIGLMYPSDYGYAAYPDAWITNLNGYNSSSITSNNWLYMGLYEWTITPSSSFSYIVFFLYSNDGLFNASAYGGCSVRPVFYLNSNVEYNGGTGTESDPFTLVV